MTVGGRRSTEVLDPVATNPDACSVVFEDDRVRVLEHHDEPGHRSTPHDHPDSVMVVLSPFRRRLSTGDRVLDVELPGGAVRWLGAQRHQGENTGDTGTRCVFVELEEGSAATVVDGDRLGPDGP